LTPLHQLSLGELAALSWLAETLSQREAVERFPDRVMAIDFDRLLAAVPIMLGRVAAHFGISADQAFLETIERSPVLQQYAKAPEHAYSRQLRAQVLSDSRRINGAEIARGMAWLERLARSNARVDAALKAEG
jgi:hypothetical protein